MRHRHSILARSGCTLLLSSCALLTACTGELKGTSSHGPGGSSAGDTPGVSGDGDDSPGDGDGGVEAPPEFEPLGGVEAIACDESDAGFGGPRIWRLTRRQYDRTVAALVFDETQPGSGFLPEPGSEQGFQNGAYQLRVRQTEAGQFQNAAKQLAERAVADHLTELFPCATDQLEDATCQQDFIESFGEKAFRRPLSSDETERYMELYSLGSDKGGGELGVTVTIEAMLQSPHFLYRFELGDFDPAAPQTVTLTPYEIASAISYFLTEGPPDEALRAAAEAGSLTTGSVREEHAQRLLLGAGGQEAQIEFYRQLFEYSGLDDVMKDATVFPEFDGLRAEFHQEMEEYVRHVLFAGSGTMADFLTADYTFANEALADFLGLEATGDDFVQVATDPAQRAGILSLAGFNSALSAQTRTSPVNRGRFVREKLLCEHIQEPPEGVDITLPALDAGMTAREQLEAKTAAPECANCHSVMNPVGFGMEGLDALGRFRTEDNGLPIDDSGELSGTRDADGPFQGVAELATLLSSSEQVQECMVLQSYRYAMGRGENRQDACVIASLRDAFVASQGNLSQLPALIAGTEEFVTREGN